MKTLLSSLIPNRKLVWPRFIVLAPVDEFKPLTKLSSFLVEKLVYGKFWTVHKVTKIRSGSLLIEATRPAKARNILDTTSFMDINWSESNVSSLPQHIEGSDKRPWTRLVWHVWKWHRQGTAWLGCGSKLYPGSFWKKKAKEKNEQPLHKFCNSNATRNQSSEEADGECVPIL